MMQGQKMCDLPSKNRRSPHTPTWHLQGRPSVGGAHRAYVKNVPPTSTVGSRMGHMAPPSHQFAPPQPQPSEDQQLLVLTPFNQSMTGTALNAGRYSTPTATEGGLQTRMPPHHPPPYPYMPPPPLQWPEVQDQWLMPPPQQSLTPRGAVCPSANAGSPVRSAARLASITEKMASMQSTYDRNARPIPDDNINDSNSNFQATAFQVEDSNVKVIENKVDHNQSSHNFKDVILNQGSYVNKKQIKPELLIDNAIQNPDSNVIQDQIQPRQVFNNVIGDQESHVNQDQIQHEQPQENVILDQGSHIIYNQIQSQTTLDNDDQDEVVNNDQDQIQPENIISQPDIDYITMTTSENDDEEILTIDKQNWASPSNTDRKKLLYDNEYKA